MTVTRLALSDVMTSLEIVTAGLMLSVVAVTSARSVGHSTLLVNIT